MPTIKCREIDTQACARLLDAGWPPVAARVLAARGISGPADMEHSFDNLPHATAGTARAAATMLAQAVSASKSVCIIGDYDADGMCATALMQLGLSALGMRVTWLLGNRELPERSLDPSLVQRAVREHHADLLVTVDNGVSAHAGIAAAKQANVPVIITDHHLADADGPCAAELIVNPHLGDSGLPAREICGTAIALLVMREVYRQCAAQQRIGKYLDLVALATIADVMPMKLTFNRAVVSLGIELIRKGRCREGIKAMLQGRHANCSSSMFSFKLGPLLNSAHRVGTPETGVAVLLAEEIAQARKHTSELQSYNHHRRQLCNNMAKQAFAAAGDYPDLPIVIHNQDWHPGIIGVLAGQLASKFGQPTAVLCGPADSARGSLRTAGDASMHVALTAIAQEAPGLLKRWGGHDGAAGCQLVGTIDRFRKLFQRHAQTSVELVEYSDGELSAAQLQDGSCERFNDIPWGQGFAEPAFDGIFTIDACQPSANNNGHNYRLDINGLKLGCYSREKLGDIGAQIRLLYTITLSTRGNNPFIFPRRVLAD